MARIRTIKPEFWTDSKIVRLPFEARLLFIGIWNFCDDDGFIPFDPLQIKLQVMPADNVNVGVLLELLIAEGLLEVVDLTCGGVALRVAHFADHQKVSHAKPSLIAPEVSGKRPSLPVAERRQLAIKYGCKPGGESDAECYFCGSPGKIWWPCRSDGQPGYWVVFTHSIDHFVPLSLGGPNSNDNLVLACEHCNKGKRAKNPIHVMLQNIPEASVNSPEDSGGFSERSVLNGIEGNGIEGNRREGKECPERSASGPAPAGSGFRFLVKAKGRQKEWELPAEKLTEYLDTFDGLDVRAELRKAKQWTHDNPAKRKTPTGMARFLTSWLSRANDQGRGRFVDEEQRRSEERKRMIAAEASRREAEQQAAKARASPSGIGAGVFRKVDGDDGEDAARRRLMKDIERV